jgi:spermidine synthase
MTEGICLPAPHDAARCKGRSLRQPDDSGVHWLHALPHPPVVVAIFLVVLAMRSPLCAEQKILYEQPSPYNNILVTEDEQGLRTLYFERDGALQSVVKPGDPDHLELPYIRTMLVGLALCEDPRRILIVGLGGGTIAKFLHKHYPQAVIDAVDIDPDVIKVARQFFEFRDDANLRAYVSDGRKFIEDRPGLYDLIFLDAFGTDSTPPHLTTREFLLSVRKALTPRGAALGNIWRSIYNPLYSSMVRTYLAVFDEVHLLDVREAVANNILIALPRRLQLSREELASRARRISQAKGFRFDMGEAIECGYRDVGKEVIGGRVLTDADKQPQTQQ